MYIRYIFAVHYILFAFSYGLNFTCSNHSPAEWWELLRVVQERRRVVHFVRFWSLSTTK